MPDTCPFCRPNWPNLDIVERAIPIGPTGLVAIIRPLNPVTEGHVLVIHGHHDESVAESFESSRRAALLMAVAADYVNVNQLQANIITSIGPAATQSVRHTHIHVVPRSEGDGLKLPWTDQHRCCCGHKATNPADLERHQRDCSVCAGLFYAGEFDWSYKG